MNSLPKTVNRQRRDYDLNPGPSAPQSSMLSTRLLRHPNQFTFHFFSVTEKISNHKIKN